MHINIDSRFYAFFLSPFSCSTKKIFAIPDIDEALYYVKLICIVFVVYGVLMFVAAIVQTYFFNRAGANLTQRVR